MLAQYSVYDDDGDAVAYTLLNDGGGPFSLTTSGSLFVDAAKGWLNYEVVQSYNLTIGVREQQNAVAGSPLLQGLQGNFSQSVSVTDVNEPPVIVFSPGGYRVDEESTYPARVTPYSNGSFIMVDDPDFGNRTALTVTVVSMSSDGNMSYFEVVNSTGGACTGMQNCVLRVKASAPRMNFDGPSSLRSVNVTVNVTDSRGLQASTGVFNVTVVDINQGAGCQIVVKAAV